MSAFYHQLKSIHDFKWLLSLFPLFFGSGFVHKKARSYCIYFFSLTVWCVRPCPPPLASRTWLCKYNLPMLLSSHKVMPPTRKKRLPGIYEYVAERRLHRQKRNILFMCSEVCLRIPSLSVSWNHSCRTTHIHTGKWRQTQSDCCHHHQNKSTYNVESYKNKKNCGFMVLAQHIHTQIWVCMAWHVPFSLAQNEYHRRPFINVCFFVYMSLSFCFSGVSANFISHCFRNTSNV